MASRSGRPVVPGTPGNVDNCAKPKVIQVLFHSPDREDDTSNQDMSKDLMNKLQIELDIEASLRGLMKDVHDNRMKQLRELQKSIAADDWRYTPTEKLIGLH